MCVIDNSQSNTNCLCKPAAEGLESYGSEFDYWDVNGCAIGRDGNCFNADCDGVVCDTCRETHHGFWGSITKSVANLMLDIKPEFNINMVTNSGLDAEAIRIMTQHYNSTAIHLTCRITYAQLLPYVWNRINKSPYRAKMLQCLATSLLNGISSNTSAIFNQTMMPLVGYCTDIGLCA